jgi:thiol:disulfide interchange protein DsbA
MTMSLRKLAGLAAAAWLLVAGTALAQGPFRVISPAQPTDPDKIEVLEFFWYGCPHCYHLEPVLNAWIKGLPKDVVFKRVPASSGGWQSLAQVFYTVEAMGLLDQLHTKIFEAIHRDGINLGNKKLRDEWLAKQGVDPAKYAEVEKSFSVVTKLQRSKQLGEIYKVDAVPQLIVNGKFLVTAEAAGGPERMIPAVDAAIAAARREKVAAAPPPAPAGTAKR